VESHSDNQRWKTRTTTAYHIEAWKCPTTLLHGGLDSSLQVTSKDPKTATKERGEKKLVVIPFYVAKNFTKL
jgi:hypothetical protein